ncbi:MAG: SDR family oxidoreductase [Acidobacteriia bacterium]|nr:SDR family oxidoreductase [Terriglobia bacterium]
MSNPTGCLKDRVIIITGAGRGIGREIALLASREGAKIVVNDLGTSSRGEGRDEGPAQQVVSEIKAQGGAAVASVESVAEWTGAQQIVKTALDAFGRVDGLVNNAALLRDKIFHKLEPEDWHAVLNVNLNGSFNMARAVAPHMRQQNSGAFVHMTSTSGLIGNFGQAHYASSKIGIAGLSRSIALDMAAFNVRSNCISPFAWTRLVATIPAESAGEIARVERMKQMGPEKIAPLAVYLLSDAAEGITSQIFAVRQNEIMLMSQPRPLRSVHRGEGWTPQTIGEHAIPALKANFYPLERSTDVFSWDPI